MKWSFISLPLCTPVVILAQRDLASKFSLQQTILRLNSAIKPLISSIATAAAPLTVTLPASTTPFHLKSIRMSRSTPSSHSRAIKFSFLAREQSEGAGATVRRSIGTPKLRHLTPFLMLDHFNVPPGAGFPDHPHRGQETITYILKGAVDHEDFAGNKGTIGPGDLQFMTAGRGIMHAEMPALNKDRSPNVGLQLWVDLPKELKYCEPRYRDLRAHEIPSVTADQGRVEIKVISGRSHGVESAKDLAYTPVWLLDITVQPGGTVEQELPPTWNAFAYTLSGAITFSSSSSAAEGSVEKEETIPPYHNVVFDSSSSSSATHVHASVPEGSPEPARFVLVAGQPLDQAIVQYGPFVSTTKEEIYQAMMDFQTHANGFERADGWHSQIGRNMGILVDSDEE